MSLVWRHCNLESSLYFQRGRFTVRSNNRYPLELARSIAVSMSVAAGLLGSRSFSSPGVDCRADNNIGINLEPEPNGIAVIPGVAQ